MKKFYMAALFAMFAMGVSAQTYSFLTVETSDGAQTSFATDQIYITFSDDNNMVISTSATTSTGSVSFPLANLNRMFFSEVATGIKSTLTQPNELSALADGTMFTIYDMTGKQILKTTKQGSRLPTDSLPKGLYIIKANGMTQKIYVR